jgi:hypothetical protein
MGVVFVDAVCLNGVMTTTASNPAGALRHNDVARPEGVDHVAEINRSYGRRVRPGQRVTALRDLLVSRHDGYFQNWEYAIVPAGTRFVVSNESNAGFRGIEASASFVGGWHLTVSTGALA